MSAQKKWQPRNLGLLFAATRIEIQDVMKAHKTMCVTCGLMPIDRRLVVTTGSGRSQQRDVYCEHHGIAFLNVLDSVVGRAKQRLVDEALPGVCVRVHPATWPKIKYKRKKPKRPKERKTSKLLSKGPTTVKGALAGLRGGKVKKK